MSDFFIRNATLEDAQIIADFNRAMALETEHKTLDAATVLSGTTGALSDAKNGFYIVTTDGEAGAVIASLLVTFEWSDWRNGVFWWIQSVYALPEQRGRGLFRALYEEVQRRAKSEGNVCGLRLYVERDNLKAMGVYEKLGMEQTPYLVYETEF